MNISQHCFMPRTKTLSGYYSLSGYFTSRTDVITTEKQKGDVYNCFQLFGSYVPDNNDYYVLRLFDPLTSVEQGSNYVGYNSGYVSPTLVKKPDVYTASAFTSRIEPNGLMVSSVMWFEVNY